MQEDGCEMTRRWENDKPETVPFAATPSGAPGSVRTWANPSVWTDRMLTTLEQGVRGGRWHTLIDKVYSPRNLMAASESVIGNRGAAGVDHQTVGDFLAHRLEELDRLHEALRTDTYRPQAVRRVWIPKPGSSEQRPLGVPTVRDRVVQSALLHVLEPIFVVGDQIKYPVRAQIKCPVRSRRGARQALLMWFSNERAANDWK